jgi:hypothetical protein
MPAMSAETRNSLGETAAAGLRPRLVFARGRASPRRSEHRAPAKKWPGGPSPLFFANECGGRFASGGGYPLPFFRRTKRTIPFPAPQPRSAVPPPPRGKDRGVPPPNSRRFEWALWPTAKGAGGRGGRNPENNLQPIIEQEQCFVGYLPELGQCNAPSRPAPLPHFGGRGEKSVCITLRPQGAWHRLGGIGMRPPRGFEVMTA